MIRELIRWLWTGQLPARPQLTVCTFCDRGKHVHDVNSGRCITIWCQCEVR